jgi:hypothetical protein
LGLAATIKDLLGIEYKDEMQGESLVKHLDGGSDPGEPLFFDDIRLHEMIDALIDQNFKLIPLRSGRFELYDLSRDPGELKNIAAGNDARIQSMLSVIQENRRQNLERQTLNISRLDSTTNTLSESEREEMLKKLKSLGYVQ